MILYITEDMTSVAFRIKETNRQFQLADWERLQLLIQPGQYDVSGCGPNGSPWILTGCWPHHRTGVDVANYRPDFPTVIYNASGLDDDGRVVFPLDNQCVTLPHGRYSGTIRVRYGGLGPCKLPIPINLVKNLSRAATPQGPIIPPEFLSGTFDCPWRGPDVESCPPPVPECCVLAQFDIDLGPRCPDHIIDQVSVEYQGDA